jgi:RNA polymerase primary sigma factor
MSNAETKQWDIADQNTFERLWYVPNSKLRTRNAAESAKRIVKWIRSDREAGESPDEQELFVALQTCAYRASRQPRKTVVPMAERLRWKERWEIVREFIVEQNVGLAYSMMGRFNFKNVDDDDILSDALYGLTRAVDRFNPFKGYRFSTYACNVVARSLMRRGKQTNRYRKLFPVQHDASMERPVEEADSQTELYVERLNRALDMNLGELTDLESTVLEKRFPSARDSRLTFREIGDAIGLSKERVRQIQNVALDKLRVAMLEDPVLQ